MFSRILAHFGHKDAGLRRMVLWILVVGASAGLVSCTTQAVERVNMLRHPEIPLACNLNPVVACSSVLNHPLASVLGFPNAFIGMVVFAGLLVGGLALVAGGEKMRAWFWYVVYGLSIILLAFAVWFFAVSLYIIGNICIFCIVCWAVAMPTFVFLTAWLARKRWLRVPQGLLKWVDAQTNASLWGIVAVIYIIMLLLVFIRFKEFFLG